VEFDRRFSTEEACRDHLARLRWPDGFRCPRCACPKAWMIEGFLMHCAGCNLQTSATAGTIFHRTRKPLRLWFQVMWWIVAQKNGASALGLQRVLGFGSYKTAWAWLHKLRRGMVRPGRDQLSGKVEVDETFLGASEYGVGRRLIRNKALVAIACEVRGEGIGRVRMESIPDATGPSLDGFVRRSIAPGSTLITDGWRAYLSVVGTDYGHQPRIQRRPEDAPRLLPRVHRVAALLKRWILGTHQGRVERSHLPYYLDEFAFRFNRRTSRSRGLLFHRLLDQAAHLAPVPMRNLVGGIKRSITPPVG
jgi:hypothetical protein